MDIKKELMEIESENSSIDKLTQEIDFEKNELLKKAHILKSVALSNKMESIIKIDVFKQNQIEFLEIYWDKNIGSDEAKLGFYILNKKQERLRVLDENHGFIKPFAIIMKETDKFGLFKQSFINEDALEHKKDMIFNLQPGLKDKLLDVLLSSELKRVLEYNKMQLELPTNDSNAKKLKM